MKVKNIPITTVLTTNSDIELYNENLATMNPLILSTKEKDLEKKQNCNCEIKYITIILKRIIDIIGAIVGIILLIPITIILFLANIISGDFGPLFYSHKRIGKNGKYFKMYKFRSMCVDADIKLDKLLKEDKSAREEWKANRKLNNDPRVTKIGKFIRKTSLDEFPQFINVLKGDMSLVRTTCCC